MISTVTLLRQTMLVKAVSQASCDTSVTFVINPLRPIRWSAFWPSISLMFESPSVNFKRFWVIMDQYCSDLSQTIVSYCKCIPMESMHWTFSSVIVTLFSRLKSVPFFNLSNAYHNWRLPNNNHKQVASADLVTTISLDLSNMEHDADECTCTYDWSMTVTFIQPSVSPNDIPMLQMEISKCITYCLRPTMVTKVIPWVTSHKSQSLCGQDIEEMCDEQLQQQPVSVSLSASNQNCWHVLYWLGS